MQPLALLLLAALAAALPQSFGTGDPGADSDDSWSVGEVSETVSFVTDRISEARKFLADLNDDNFDFQQWYTQQLADFTADQDNVAYNNPDDQASDLEDFKQQLDAISVEFASSQGEDYANFVRDIIGEGIDHLNQQGQELLQRMDETANDINNLEEQEFDLYVQMAKIGCIDDEQSLIPVGAIGTGTPEGETGEPTEEADGFWPNAPDALSTTGPTVFTPPSSIPARTTCYLSAISEELNEYYKKFFPVDGMGNPRPVTSSTQNQYRRKIQAASKQYRSYVAQWKKLYHTFQDVQAKEEHESDEYNQYEGLLHDSQTLQEFGMQGSDALVLPDNRIPTVSVTP